MNACTLYSIRSYPFLNLYSLTNIINIASFGFLKLLKHDMFVIKYLVCMILL